MRDKIDVTMLSQTSQDAMAITRSLGLRYLWIDSLCIIQDDVNDWRTESARMGEIFKSSLFTIAASWVSSDREGCFFDRGSLFAKLAISNGTHINSRSPYGTVSAVGHEDKWSLSRHRSSERRLPSDQPDPHTLFFDQILKRRHDMQSIEISTEVQYPPASKTPAYSGDRSVPPQTNLSSYEDPDYVGANRMNELCPKRKRPYSVATPNISDHYDESEDLVKISFDPMSGSDCTAAQPDLFDIEALYIEPSQNDLWLHSVEASPLNRRAWVLQERLLSPRTVYYTKTQLFWECRESKACESSPAPESKTRMEWDGSLTYLKSSHELHGPIFEPWHLHWPEIVEQYTNTSRTKLEDKLVAISGLAREIQSITKDKYCAGIWRKAMVSELLWHLIEPQHEVGLPYQAPSWSWASTEGKVEFQRRDSEYVTTELDIISVQSIGIDGKPWSFGQIEHGSLHARGVLRSAWRCERSVQKYKLLLTDQLDEALDANDGEYYPDTALGLIPENPLCLPIARISSGASLGEDENSLHGIIAGIVVEPTGEFEGEYRRLGFFRVLESAGVTWFGLNDRRDICHITLI